MSDADIFMSNVMPSEKVNRKRGRGIVVSKNNEMIIPFKLLNLMPWYPTQTALITQNAIDGVPINVVSLKH